MWNSREVPLDMLEELDIKKNVRLIKEEVEAATVVFSPRREEYLVVVPSDETLREQAISLYHELGHISLAENIHPIFAEFYLSFSEGMDKRIKKVLEWVIRTSADVLVNDLLWRKMPEVAFQEVASSVLLVKEIGEEVGSFSEAKAARFSESLRWQAFALFFALTKAIVRRHRESLGAKWMERLVESFPRQNYFPLWELSYEMALEDLPEGDFGAEEYLSPLRPFLKKAFACEVSLEGDTFYFKKASVA